MKGCKRILLLRHLPTYYNKEGYITGQCDIDINENVKSEQIVVFSGCIYSSPLKRCRQTVKKITGNRPDEIIYDGRLAERNMGIFEGRKRNDIIREYPDYFVNRKFNVFMEPPQGEAFAEFYNRINSFYTDIICSCNEEILICSHNHALKVLKCIIEQEKITLEYWNGFNFKNGEIFQI